MALLNEIDSAKYGTSQVDKIYLGPTKVWENFVPISATGGTITTIDVGGRDYRVHTFTSSGTFEVTGVGNSGGSFEYLLVAGGGSGGGSSCTTNRGGGGGGAGGLLSGTATASVQSYPVVIGSGGAQVACEVSGNNGQDSTFNGLTAVGGGGGGSAGAGGKSGGSGGGGGDGYPSSGQSGGAGTSGQGFAGGGSTGATFSIGTYGGGGGGATGVGGTGAESVPGTSGPGLTSEISGTSVEYAKGGGGGTGGAGVNGRGNGGRGGGDNDGDPGLAGGDGVLIIRYPIEAA